MENSTEPYKGRLVDYLWALSILTIPALVCIMVVGICIYLCLVRPGVDFTYILHTDFASADPKSAKVSLFCNFRICAHKNCSKNVDEIDPWYVLYISSTASCLNNNTS